MKEWDNTEAIVNKVFGLKLVTETRERPYVEARAVFYKIMREVYNKHLQTIGRKTNRTHATVINGVMNARNWVEMDECFRNKYHESLELVEAYNRTFKEYTPEDELAQENFSLKKRNKLLTLQLEVVQKEIDTAKRKGSPLEGLFCRIEHQFKGDEGAANRLINKFLNGVSV
tara:strand:+ start:1238 stop:1753 length:516 start_codon:yes stop_codon:yes gene_type:complete